MPQFTIEIDDIWMYRAARADIAYVHRSMEEANREGFARIEQLTIPYKACTLIRGEAPEHLISQIMALAQGHPVPRL